MDIRQNAFYESQRWWDYLWASVSIKAERSQNLTDLEKCQNGDFKICAELGKAYCYGNGVTKDIKRRHNFTKKLSMAKRCLDAVLSFCWFFNGFKSNRANST